MKKLLQSLFILLFVASAAMAQDRTITGTVTSKEDGLPLPGVSVKVVGTKNVVQTGSDGHYSVKVGPSVKALEFVFIGYQSEILTLGSNSTLNLTMATDSKGLSEVVVVGYGTSKSLGTTVASVKKVSGEVVADRPIANAFDALQGQVAGLQVYTSSGEPSASSSLRLHGSGSLGASSTPLYLLDGIPTDGGNVISLNPNDIESIEVLKDASATSIYGSRAANGVIAIVTKRGSANKASINLTSQYSVSNLTSNAVDFFESFMSSEELLNFRLATGGMSQAQVDNIRTNYPGVNTKWYQVMYKDDLPTYQNDISISGGSGKTTYYISASQFKQDGLAYRSAFERYTLMSNINTKVTNWFDIGLKLQVSTDKRQTNPYGSNNSYRGLAPYLQPWFSNKDKNGVEYPDVMTEINMYNPKYLATKILSDDRQYLFNPSAYIQITPFKGLTFKSQAGADAYDYNREGGTLPSYLGANGVGSWSQNFYRSISTTIFNTLEYKFDLFGDQKHKFVALAGHEYSDNTYTEYLAGVSGIFDDRLTGLQNGKADTRTTSTSKTEYAFNSFFGRLEYSLLGKYFAEGTLRQDKSSRFGINNKAATFWSAGARWNMKKENFLSNVNWLNELSLKLSTGTSGNSGIGNYSHYQTVSVSTAYLDPAYVIGAVGNPNLTWEKQRKTTIGIRTELFNRIRLEVEGYKRVTSSMLVSVPKPYTTGWSSEQQNVGSLQNMGLDVDLNFDAYTNREKKISIVPYINFNFNRDKITELFDGKQYWIIANTGVSWVVGQGVTYLQSMFAGVNPANGDATWYVPNPGDGFVNTRTDRNATTNVFNEAALQQNTGIRRYAPLNGGFGFNASYGNFSLITNFSFSKGKYLINNDAYFFENPNVFPTRNQRKVVQDYWKKPGDVTQFPRNGVQFTQFDDRLIQDASFLRLKFIEFGYSLPKSLLSKTNVIKSARFSVGARNWLTWTKYTGPDPEVDSNLSLGANPNTKQVTFGLSVGF